MQKVNVTIKGTAVNSSAQNGNGIKAADTLKIRNTRINFSGVEDGIQVGQDHGNKLLIIDYCHTSF